MILRRAGSSHSRKAFSVRPASNLVQSSGVVVPVALSFHVLRSRSPWSGPRGRLSVELALVLPGIWSVPSPWAASSCFSASASSSAPSSCPSGDPRIRAVGSSEAFTRPALGCLPFRVCAARYGAVAHRHVVGSCVCVRRVLWVFLLGILYTTNPNWVSRDTGIRLLFCCVGVATWCSLAAPLTFVL